MSDIQWKKLQNGSDIRGVALDGVKGEYINLTDEVVLKLACAFAKWLSDKTGKPSDRLKISVGNDSRLSGPSIRAKVIEGLRSMGCHVFNCGLSSTPAMFMSTVIKGYEYDGAIMITASHLPYNRNGLKFFTNEGGLEKQDITNILNIAQSMDEAGFKPGATYGHIDEVDFISVYAANLVAQIREKVNHPTQPETPLKGFKIVVDAGNGAGGFFVEKVLAPLGADTTGSQFLDPDGSFPNHIPNPEDKAAMDSIQKAVIDNKADLGIIFDTDVDRAGAVDKNGKEINRNRLIAMMSAIILEEHPHSAVVTDSITSTGLKKFIENELGGIHHRFKRGYKNVINESIRLNKEGNESHLAIETSGHGALKENYFLDDGAYLISKILVKMARMKVESGKTIESLIEDLEEPLESKEFRLNISADDFKAYGGEILKELEIHALKNAGWAVEPNNFEGIRVSFDKNNGDGWFLLRMSLHDPLMPLNIESNSPGGVKIIASKLLPFMEKFVDIDTGSINEYIK